MDWIRYMHVLRLEYRVTLLISRNLIYQGIVISKITIIEQLFHEKKNRLICLRWTCTLSYQNDRTTTLSTLYLTVSGIGNWAGLFNNSA